MSEQDRSGKIERMYSYVTGQDFKHRVASIVEGYETLKRDLDKEKKFMMAGWSRREKYHDQIMIGVQSMGGDLQGIVGEAMPEIDSLEAAQADCEPISLPTTEPKPLRSKELAAD